MNVRVKMWNDAVAQLGKKYLTWYRDGKFTWKDLAASAIHRDGLEKVYQFLVNRRRIRELEEAPSTIQDTLYELTRDHYPKGKTEKKRAQFAKGIYALWFLNNYHLIINSIICTSSINMPGCKKRARKSSPPSGLSPL